MNIKKVITSWGFGAFCALGGMILIAVFRDSSLFLLGFGAALFIYGTAIVT